MRRIFTSRLGHVLVALHLCLLAHDVGRKEGVGVEHAACSPVSGWDVSGELFAGRYYHLSYESALFKSIVLLDLPSWLLGEAVSAAVFSLFPSTCVYTASWIKAGIVLFLTSAQWLIAGFVVGRVARNFSSLLPRRG